MSLSPIHSLTLTAIQQVSPDRLQKAVCGLADGSLTITLTRQSDRDIRALVQNGDGAEYGVTLTESLTTCSCKDALYRGGVCKHAVAVALHVLRTPEPQQEAKEAPVVVTVTSQAPVVVAPEPHHLQWWDSMVVCGEPDPLKTWRYPWTDYMLTWPEACKACVKVYRNGYNRHVAQKAAA